MSHTPRNDVTPASEVVREIAAGSGLSLAGAAKLFPSYRAGRPVNPTCIWRWARAGVRLSDGRTVRLEVSKVAGRWLTSTQAVERFIAAQQAPHASDAGAPAAPRTPRARQRAAERAGAELAKVGL
jgi:hypothetical protein